LHLFIFFWEKGWIISRRRVIMRKMKFGILLVFAVLALVSVASAALPSQVTATLNFPGPVSYFDVDVTSGGSGDLPNANDYIGWCASSQNGINLGSQTFQVWSSLETLPSGIPTADWKKINYVINNKAGADKYTIQAVVWYYDGGPIPWGTVDGTPTTGKMGELIAAADAAILANPTYTPGPGENYAVILWNQGTPGTQEPVTYQPVFIEIPIPGIPTPEFPTLALPVAMLIGVVGAVQFIRARKE
jgi:hypothetical protein